MDDKIIGLIRAKKAKIKIGVPYCVTDEYGNTQWRVGQFLTTNI